jgi:hypothetical protein
VILQNPSIYHHSSTTNNCKHCTSLKFLAILPFLNTGNNSISNPPRFMANTTSKPQIRHTSYFHVFLGTRQRKEKRVIQHSSAIKIDDTDLETMSYPAFTAPETYGG